MVNDKEFQHYSDGIFKPYFEKFIEYKRTLLYNFINDTPVS